MADMFDWTPIGNLTLRVTIDSSHTGIVYIHWGDGTAPTSATSARPVQHQYPRPGGYTLRASNSSGHVYGYQQAVVRDGSRPVVEVAYGADTDWLLEVRFIDDPKGLLLQHITVDWIDNKPDPTETHWAIPGTSTRRAVVTQPNPYTKWVKVTDDMSRLQGYYSVTITQPEYDPDFTLARDPDDPSGRTVVLTATNQNDRELDAYWGDISVPTRLEGGTATHTYDSADTYLIQLAEVDGEAVTAKSVVIPMGDTDG